MPSQLFGNIKRGIAARSRQSARHLYFPLSSANWKSKPCQRRYDKFPCLVLNLLNIPIFCNITTSFEREAPQPIFSFPFIEKFVPPRNCFILGNKFWESGKAFGEFMPGITNTSTAPPRRIDLLTYVVIIYDQNSKNKQQKHLDFYSK